MNVEADQVQKFIDYCETADFGNLSDVRDYVIDHCLDNACDVPKEAIFDVCVATLKDYLDCPESAEIFDGYRT